MELDRLTKLEDVLTNLGPNRKIKDFKTTRLTAPGQNYGSLMLAVDVQVVNEKTKREETLHLVAKLLPSNDFVQELFNVQVTFRNEVGFYQVIVPLLEKFQKEQGVSEVASLSPKFYGARISLNPESDKVDNDAVFILENLKIAGYTTAERMVGVDLDTAKLITKNLAKFGAIPLAFKLKKPQEFEKKIKPFLTDFHFADDGIEGFTNTTTNVLSENPKCVPYIEKVKALLRQKSVKVVREPFATIMHNDCWTNNIMVKFENGKPVASTFVDYQVIEYKSPCRDLLFFIFSSLRLDILKDGVSIDDLINLYYKTFIEQLVELKCDTELFNRELFDKELELAAKESEYFHVIIMHNPIYAQEHVKELNDMTPDDFQGEVPVTTIYKQRVQFVTLEFARRGWL